MYPDADYRRNTKSNNIALHTQRCKFQEYVLGCNRVNDVAKNVALRFPPVAYMLMASTLYNVLKTKAVITRE